MAAERKQLQQGFTGSTPTWSRFPEVSPEAPRGEPQPVKKGAFQGFMTLIDNIRGKKNDGTAQPGIANGKDSLLPTETEKPNIVADVLFNTYGKDEVLNLKDMREALKTYAHPTVLQHVDPPIAIPAELTDAYRNTKPPYFQLPRGWNPKSDEFRDACADLRDFFRGQKDEQGSLLNSRPSENVSGFKAVDRDGNLLAIGAIRFRGHQGNITERQRIASVEKFARVQGESFVRQGVGTITMAKALDYAFFEYKGYKGKGASEIRASTYFDSQSGDHNINSDWLQKMGFNVISEHEIPGTKRHVLTWGIKEDKWKTFRENVDEVTWPIPERHAIEKPATPTLQEPSVDTAIAG